MFVHEIIKNKFAEVEDRIYSEDSYTNAAGDEYISYYWNGYANSYEQYKEILAIMIEGINKLTFTEEVFKFNVEQDSSGFGVAEIIITYCTENDGWTTYTNWHFVIKY